MKYALALGAIMAPALVAGHGLLTSPKPRMAGSSFESICGLQIYNMMSSDAYGNIQGETQLKQSDFTAECNLWLCKGFQYSDNTANVQSYTTGQVVDMTFDIRAPHTGFANVSVVDTATNTVIGDQLISWDVFASNSVPTQADQLSFSVTIPDLGGKCTTAGECVIQHYWNSDSAGQTYESCVDFTVGGSSSSSAGSSSSVVATTEATTSSVATSVAATSTVAAPTTAVTSTTSAVSSVAASSSLPATKVTSAAVTITSSAPAATETDDSCDAEDVSSAAATITTEVTGALSSVPAVKVTSAATTTTASAPAATETGDDASCDADDAGDAADDEDDDSCEAETSSSAPAATISSAYPTTLVTRTSSKPAAASATAASTSGSVALYGRCGGIGYTGATSCAVGTCKVMNPYYSQCVQA